MRILSVTALYPYPPNGGSNARVWRIAEELARRHEVIMVATGRPQNAVAPSASMVRLEQYPAEMRGRPAVRLSRLARSLRRGWQPSITAAVAPEAVKRIQQLINERWPDVVVAEENLSGGFLWAVPPRVPRVWVKHSIHALDAREARYRYGSWKPTWLLNEWLARRYEAATLARADMVVAMCREDADKLTQQYGAACVEVVGLGSDLTARRVSDTPEASIAAFMGHFSWQANADAVEWLIHAIWPRVRAAIPDARLRLIGGDLGSDLIRHVSSDEVQVVGHADDPKSALRDVAVNLVPVRIGTGVRAKFLDGLAMGLPTVSTALGARGTGAQDGVHYLLADTTEDTVAAVLRLFRDRELRRVIGQQARELGRSLTWAAKAQEMEKVLARVVDCRKDAALPSS